MKKVVIINVIIIILLISCSKKSESIITEKPKEINNNQKKESIINPQNDKSKDDSEKIEYAGETGVAIIDGKPAWIDVEHMFMPILAKSRIEMEKSKGTIIKNALLSFLTTSGGMIRKKDTYKENPFLPIKGRNIDLFLKIENDKMYVRKDKEEWDRLYMSNVELEPKEKNLIFKVYLKCKYFEGEYVVHAHP